MRTSTGFAEVGSLALLAGVLAAVNLPAPVRAQAVNSFLRRDSTGECTPFRYRLLALRRQPAAAYRSARRPIPGGSIRSQAAGLSPGTPGSSPIEEWVRSYGSDLQPSVDFANALTVGRDGSVYVAGTSDATSSGGDYLVLKYSGNGVVVWTARYRSTANSANEPTAIGVDSSGNVYVTGYSSVSRSNTEYLTVKFNSNGVEQWAAVSDRSPDSTDVATSLAVDAQGNVFVTGYSYSPSSDLDYVTVKYTTDGAEVWAARYDGPGRGLDVAAQIALDRAGDADVTGFSRGAGTGLDFATVSYDPQGVERWVSRYDSPSHGDDAAVTMVVDLSDNVVVSGSSSRPASGEDFVTVKYSPSGSTVWQQEYNGPANGDDWAVAAGCDSSGNVYVTGQSMGIGTQEDFETIKYDRNGILRWAARFNNARNGPDTPVGLAVGGSGNVFVTGISRSSPDSRAEYETVVYNPDGDVLVSWLYHRFGGGDNLASEIAVDSDDNAYVTGGSKGNDFDFATVKYASGIYQGRPAHYSSGAGGDRVAGMAADAFKNVFVTGSNAEDMRTVKFDPAGAVGWAAVFAGLRSPEAAGLVLDGKGNVYVTGHGYGVSGSLDIVTIKYNPSGTEQWEDIYDGPAGGDDRAAGICVDAQQNVYVIGSSHSSATGDDYVTIKYDSLGGRRWVAQYDGPASLADDPAALALDPEGNVYVTGSSIREFSSNDYATIKYSGSGDRQWVAYYNGPANGSDFATAIALDADGGIYVTGKSLGTISSSDFATVKYNPFGQQQWASRYTGPGNGVSAATAIAVDRQKNVFVTGYAYTGSTSFDYATVRYDSGGVLLWKVLYNGPADGVDRPVGLLLDRQENVFVTGSSLGPGTGLDFATVAYDAGGAQEQVVRYNGHLNLDDEAEAIAIDSSGTVYVAGESFVDSSASYFLLRYTNGSSDWPSVYDGPGVSFDVVDDFVVDSAGNSYLTGGGYAPDASLDLLTVKYNSAGVRLWAARYAGQGSASEEGRKIAVDREGNVCVTGLSYNSQGLTDYLTVKYTGDGNQRWVAQYSRPGGSYNFPKAVAVDGNLNVYVTGTTYNGRSYDYTTVKYDSAGVMQWSPNGISYDGPAGADDLAAGIVVDGNNDIIVTGSSFGPGSSLDYATVKYRSDGREAWVARYNGPGNGDDRVAGIAVDSSGNVCITGTSVDTSRTFDDFATVSYDSAGVLRWSALYESGPGTLNEAVAISAGPRGDVYVSGNSYDPTSTYSDFVTVKYDPAGARQWAAPYDGPVHADDFAVSNQLDASGSVYVAGTSMGQDGSSDFAVVKYGSGGGLAWTARYGAAGGSIDEAKGIRLDARGNVYVAGNSSGFRWRTISTVKYSQGTSGVAGGSPDLPSSFTVFQNYPNPFNPQTTIRYALPRRDHVRVSVYDLLGREVARPADGVEEAGLHSVRFDAGTLSSGVYFYRVRSSGGQAGTRKMVVLR